MSRDSQQKHVYICHMAPYGWLFLFLLLLYQKRTFRSKSIFAFLCRNDISFPFDNKWHWILLKPSGWIYRRRGKERGEGGGRGEEKGARLEETSAEEKVQKGWTKTKVQAQAKEQRCGTNGKTGKLVLHVSIWWRSCCIVLFSNHVGWSPRMNNQNLPCRFLQAPQTKKIMGSQIAGSFLLFEKFVF